jgi:ribonuclease HI
MPGKGKIIIYTDGGSRGNPGPSGIGVVFADEKGRVIKKYSKAIGIKTNNEAEYEAVIFALAKAKQLFGKGKVKNFDMEIRMDSELVCRQLRGEYKIQEEKLFPLFIKIWNLRIEFGRIIFTEVPRAKNKEADALVNEALGPKMQESIF